MSAAATTTAIARQTADYPFLEAGSRQAAIIAANLGGDAMRETDLVRVKSPLGGSTTWTIERDGNEETTDSIVGLLVGIGRRGYLWPHEDPSESRPLVVTHDMRVGYLVGEDFGSVDPAALDRFKTGDGQYDWIALSNSREFGWGSGRGGRGKRVKEKLVLAILRPGDTWPILVTIGGGSSKDVSDFLRRLSCFAHEAVVKLTLTRAKSAGGQPYSKIVASLDRALTPEEGEVAKKIYWDPISTMFSTPPAFSGGGESDDGGPF